MGILFKYHAVLKINPNILIICIRSSFLFTLLSVVFISCLKEETPVIPPSPGELETVQIEIGYPYLNQVYYNCAFNEITGINTKYDWDLSFESSKSGYHVLLNTAKGIFISREMSKSFEDTLFVDDDNWIWDKPNGDLDSTAFGNWLNKNETYIIDRQFDANGNHLGYKKIQLLNVTDKKYTFKFANLDGSNEVLYIINKVENLNFIHFNFNSDGTTLLLEPSKDNWDLLFTNHHHKFDNLPLPFVLTQVLSNKYNGVVIAEDNDNNFLEITLKDTINYQLTNKWDEIGYDWKIRNSQDNSFNIDENKSYIVKTTKGLFFKIRFIDFYNDNGVKGYPKFEIQRL